MKKKFSISVLRWMLAHTRGNYWRIVFLIVSNAVVALTSVGYALACKGIIDAAVAGKQEGIIRHIALILIILAVDFALTILRRMVAEIVSSHLYVKIQNDTIGSLVEKAYGEIAHYHSGELLNRLFSDVQIVANGITNTLPSLVYLISRLVGAAVTLFSLAPQFTLLFLGVGTGISLTMTLLRDKIKRLHKDLQNAEGKTRAFMQEVLERLLVIKVFHAKDSVLTKLQRIQEKYVYHRMKSRTLNIASSTGFSLIFDVGHILALVWGCFGILNKALSYGTLTAMLQLVGQVQQPFNGFSGLLAQVYTIAASAERIIDIENLSDDPAQEKIPYQDLSAICFDNVSFTYGRTEVLRNVNFAIHKGDMVSITGTSGGGKSTLFLLLLGAYSPTAGEIHFEQEASAKAIHPGRETRRLCAYVPQGNYLMTGTLRENLTFYREDVSETDIWHALEQACAAGFVRELPEGLETPLGEKGNGLSEGQMQRIAIARALLSKAPVLLLDEATSALDEETEARLLRNISELQERTCLIVTHRSAALSICNRHLVIREGSSEEE